MSKGNKRTQLNADQMTPWKDHLQDDSIYIFDSDLANVINDY